MPKLDKHAELQAKIEQLEQELAQTRDQALRAQADSKNILRRVQDERGRLVKMAAAEVIVPLLEPLDHLELAAAQLNDQGLKMVVAQFHRVLAEQGLTEIEAEGRAFDPRMMEAANGSQTDGKSVTQVKRPGYLLNGELLRTALVIVE
jgi:molecular chaperone GrpE